MNKFDVSIFVITRGNECIFANEYDIDSEMFEDDATFIMITNDRLNQDYRDDNTMFIEIGWKVLLEITANKPEYRNIVCFDMDLVGSYWQFDRGLIKNINICKPDYNVFEMNKQYDYVLNYLDGYKATQQIISNKPYYCRKQDLPAIMMCHDTKVYHYGNFYNGYLPAIGQLVYLSYNINEIECLYNQVSDKPLNISHPINHNHLYNTWWSSTQYDDYDVWTIDSIIEYKDKLNNDFKILPLFPIRL